MPCAPLEDRAQGMLLLQGIRVIAWERRDCWG